jgi:hypothetical protein
MRMTICAIVLMLFWFVAVVETNAQAVPASVKREIIGQLKKSGSCQSEYFQFSVEAVRIGPRKRGFIGDCRYGGGISVVYEAKPNGLKKLFQIEVGMNGGFSVGDKAFNGYYELSHYERSGPSDVVGETYRWNGRGYALHSKD